MRPSANVQLYDRIAQLEAQLASTQSALLRSQERDRELSRSPSVEVELNESGYLLIHLPGAHTLRWAMGLTQHDMALTMKALVTVLRGRNEAEGRPNPIGTAGAPTINDLRALASASKVTAKRAGLTKRAVLTSGKLAELTLEDLGL